MKKIAFFMLSMLVLSVCAAEPKLKKQDKLLLPENIYAVVGNECNIYFRNVFLAINYNNYVFDIECKDKIGRNDLKRWRFTPEAKHGGKTFPLTLKVYDCENTLVAESTANVHVAPADAGKDKKITILMVGDSLTNHTVYPARLYELCKKENNPRLDMIGTRHYDYKGANIAKEVLHEGYSGWKWESFLTRFEDTAKKNKKYTKSKFLYMKDGKITVSPADFLKTYKFKTPDIITFQLGVNDVFQATDEDRAERIAKIIENADKLVSAFRKDMPDAVIGIGLVTSGANQDAFGSSYKCGQTSWGYHKNHFYLNKAMVKHFAGKDPKLFIVPANTGLDTENNFPVKKEAVNVGNSVKIERQSNGVHPAISGYNQMGDVYYAWLKNMLAR